MTTAELDRIIAAIKSGKRFSIYGADGEWGYEYLSGNQFRAWATDPSEVVPDRIVDEASVRKNLEIFDYERIASRLS